MKKSLFFIFAVWFAILGVGCSEKFDDTSIWDKLNSLEERVAALEQLCRQMNTNITSLQTIVEALQNKDYITNIAPINEEGKVIGYTMTFSKSGSVTIYNGKDGQTPSVGVKKDVDNLYYWTLNGEWLLDEDGNKIRAEGVDGDNGLNGIAPKLKIEDDYWYVSYDNGTTWTKLDKATGKDGDSMFSQITYDDDNVYFTLTDGTKLVIPRRPPMPLNNEIWYTATEKVEPSVSEAWGITTIANEWNATTGEGVITFSGDVTSIGDDAFVDCSALQSITMPSGVTKVGNQTFKNCSNLQSVKIPDGVTEIGERAFFGCSSVQNIAIPNSVTTIGRGAFYGCETLQTINIPNSVTEIGASLFADCSNLQNITIPDGVTVIGASAFSGCSSLQSVTIPNGVTSIGSYAFYGCSGLLSVAMPSGVTEIGASTFSDCSSLKNVTIPDGVTKIGNNSFYKCGSLESVTIPNSVARIGNNAFKDCNGLQNVYVKAVTPPTGSAGMFTNVSSSLKIYVTYSSLDSYKTANYWKNYADKIVGYDFGE